MAQIRQAEDREISISDLLDGPTCHSGFERLN